MGYVKEPKGVDFIIKSDPLTDEERAVISAFIRSEKMKQAALKPSGKRPRQKKNKTLS